MHGYAKFFLLVTLLIVTQANAGLGLSWNLGFNNPSEEKVNNGAGTGGSNSRHSNYYKVSLI